MKRQGNKLQFEESKLCNDFSCDLRRPPQLIVKSFLSKFFRKLMTTQKAVLIAKVSVANKFANVPMFLKEVHQTKKSKRFDSNAFISKSQQKIFSKIIVGTTEFKVGRTDVPGRSANVSLLCSFSVLYFEEGILTDIRIYCLCWQQTQERADEVIG